MTMPAKTLTYAQKEEHMDAIRANNEEALAALIVRDGPYVNYDFMLEGDSPLCAAVPFGSFELIQLVAAQYIDINRENENGTTPLLAAIFRRDMQIFNFILALNPDVNKADNDLTTPLMECCNPLDDAGDWHYAVALDMAKSLIAKGADINARDNRGACALSWVLTMNADPTMPYLLLENGADPNLADESGFTPFFAAMKRGDPAFVRDIVLKGADTNLTMDDGRTAMDIYGKPETVAAIQDTQREMAEKRASDNAMTRQALARAVPRMPRMGRRL